MASPAIGLKSVRSPSAFSAPLARKVGDGLGAVGIVSIVDYIAVETPHVLSRSLKVAGLHNRLAAKRRSHT